MSWMTHGEILACSDTPSSLLVQEREGMGWAATLQFSSTSGGVSD